MVAILNKRIWIAGLVLVLMLFWAYTSLSTTQLDRAGGMWKNGALAKAGVVMETSIPASLSP